MKLVAMQCRFSEANVNNSLVSLEGLKRKAILMPGCAGYDIYSSEDGAVAVIQRWNDMAAFDAYRASTEFLALGKELKPLMATAPVTTVAEVNS